MFQIRNSASLPVICTALIEPGARKFGEDTRYALGMKIQALINFYGNSQGLPPSLLQEPELAARVAGHERSGGPPSYRETNGILHCGDEAASQIRLPSPPQPSPARSPSTSASPQRAWDFTRPAGACRAEPQHNWSHEVISMHVAALASCQTVLSHVWWERRIPHDRGAGAL